MDGGSVGLKFAVLSVQIGFATMLLAATAVNDKNGVTAKAAVKASDRFTCIWDSSLSLAVGKRYVFLDLGVTFPHGGAA
jgi:hypothetical protein